MPLSRANLSWGLWYKKHADNHKDTWNELHSERRYPLGGVGAHVPLNAIADPEANTRSCLHTDLIYADKSASDRGR
jgi:hypothetical protein